MDVPEDESHTACWDDINGEALGSRPSYASRQKIFGQTFQPTGDLAVRWNYPPRVRKTVTM